MLLSSTLFTFLACHLAAPLHVDNNYFKDESGRVVVLRGINTPGNAKVPPFTPLTESQMLSPLPGLGFNVIRLLFTWEAFEPAPGQYSQAYLDYYTQVVRWARERGIYTLVDFHQDALSRYLLNGCGEGFPAWALPKGVRLFQPDNGVRCAKWFLSMWLDHDLWRTWRALYRDERGMQQAYVAMAKRAAQHLAQEPGVVGYDLINEPIGDEITELAPFYEEVGQAIRSVHPDSVLFIEPHVRTDVGIQSDLPTPSFTNIAYAPHFYDKWTTVLTVYLGSSFRQPFEKMVHKAADLQSALFVGEFGGAPSTRNMLGYMSAVYDRFDDHFISGAQWSYTPQWNETEKDGWNVEDLSIIDAAGKMRGNFEPRAYAQKIAGTPVRQHVRRSSAADSEFELTYVANPRTGSTEIYVPSLVDGKARHHRIETRGDDIECSLSGHLVTCATQTEGVKTVLISSSHYTF